MEGYKVGDEVIVNGKRCVVTKYVENSLLYVIDKFGITSTYGHSTLYNRDNIKKTGKFYPQIAEVLNELEEPMT